MGLFGQYLLPNQKADVAKVYVEISKQINTQINAK